MVIPLGGKKKEQQENTQGSQEEHEMFVTIRQGLTQLPGPDLNPTILKRVIEEVPMRKEWQEVRLRTHSPDTREVEGQVTNSLRAPRRCYITAGEEGRCLLS